MSRGTVKWVGLALVGLLIAAGVSIAASRLASKEIGLASEPIQAGNALAPASERERHRRPEDTTATPPPTTPGAPAEPRTTPPAPSVETPPEGGDDESGGEPIGGADD